MLIKGNKYIDYQKNFTFGVKYIKNVMVDYVLSKYFKIYLDTHKTTQNDKKYTVSICGIFKNEAPYLREWIEYHKIVGVDHFYLYNNNSNDDYLNIIREYIDEGTVTLFDWNEDRAQMKAYKHCMTNHSYETQWMGFIDIDEFVVPIVKDSIAEVLSGFSNRPAIIVYWKMFGSGGKIHREDGLVTERFTKCYEKLINSGKVFWNTKYQFDEKSTRNSIFHHIMWCRLNGKELPSFNIFDEACFFFNGITFAKRVCPMQINHYYTKSFEEYMEKCKKGDVFFETNSHNYDAFMFVERLVSTADYSIIRFLSELKIRLKKDHLYKEES